MKRTLVWALALTILLAIGVSADDRRTDKSMLVIMTLNAEFLWDGVDPEEGQVVFDWKGSQTEAEEHMQEIADVIIRVDPDMVNLAEIENIEALTTFNDKFLAGRGYEPYLVKGKDTFTGQDVALLTRIDPVGGQIERDDSRATVGDVNKGVSKNYFAKFDLGDSRKIALVGLHFLARPTSSSRRLAREAQAEVIRSRAVTLAQDGFEVVVLGDFNDFDGNSDSLDHIDSTPITNVLLNIRGMDPDNAADDLLNVAALVPKPERFTAFYDRNDNDGIDPPKEFTSIDHILLSQELVAEVEVVTIPHNHDPRFVTDHFAVVVHLDFDDTAPPADTVRMVRLLPNPPGSENKNEEITLKNFTSQSVNLTGWTVRDAAGKSWSLDSLGTLAPGEEKTIKRDGQRMALNNRGDTVDLIDPQGVVVQTITYARVAEGEEVFPAN